MRSLRKNPPEFRYPAIVHSGAEMHPFCIIFRAGTDSPKTLLKIFSCIARKIECVRCEKTNPRYATRQWWMRVPRCDRFASFFVPEPNAQKHSQTCSSVYLGRLHAFVAKKSTRVSLPGNSAFGCRNAPVLHHFSFRNRMLKNTPKHVLGYNYEDCMRSLRKNPPEFRYPAIVHSGAGIHPFCIIFRSGTECSKTLPNMFYAIPMRIACVLCEKIHPSFATRQYAFGCQNAPVLHHFSFRNRMLKNSPKHVLGYNYEDCMRSLRKNPIEFRYMEIVHSGAEMHPFCIIFRSRTKCSKTMQKYF